MKKYFKIGEIAKLYHIGVDSIRYYEEIGIIHPMRSPSGYRQYSIQDIWRLNVIRDLRSIGFTMEQIRIYLDHHTTASTVTLLKDEQAAIQKEMVRLQTLEKNVSKRLQTICDAQSLPLHEIMKFTLPSRRCFGLSEGYEEEEEMDLLMKRLLNLSASKLSIIGNNQMGTVVSRSKLINKKSLSYQSVFLIDEEGDYVIPEGDYLCVTYRGDYAKSIFWGLQLEQYAKEHHLTVTGDFLELLWIDIHTSSNREEHITQLQLPVKE